MSDHAQHPSEFLPELALGVLSEAEAARVRGFLADCAECAEEFALISAAVELLPVAAEQNEPAPRLREAVLAAIAAETTQDADAAPAPVRFPVERSRPPRWQSWALGAAAAAAVAVGAGFAGFALRDTEGADSRQAAVIEAAGRGDLQVARFQDGAMLTSVVRVPGHSEGFVWVENLPALPEGKAYQAWFTRDFEEFEPSQVFHSASGGLWVEAGDAIDGYLAMGLTIEDEDGADVPSSAPFVVVELQRSARTFEVPWFMQAGATP